jgi:sterol desaturase/sphingolipid hydroxylase (fatty acid hydroxylase superfamily)
VKVLRTSGAAGLVGAVSWTLTEYLLHRFAMHVLRGRGLASREHLTHHADVTYFSPMSKKLASAAGTTAIAFPLTTAIGGRRWATAFTAGLLGAYGLYEVAHRRLHTHPPRTRYGRWARRHHLHHHFGAPMRNFGVTSPVWDHLFGTNDAVHTVAVPRRSAPTWLLDDAGDVRSEFADEYRVPPQRGRVTAREFDTDRDRNDAFANRAPQP